MEAGVHPRPRARGMVVLVAVAAAVVSVLVFTPRFVVWRGLDIPDLLVFPEVNRATDALHQLHDPFGPIAHRSNHAIRWRLLMPLAARGLGLPDPVFLSLPAVGCLLTLMVVAGWLQQRGWRWDEVFCGTLLAATCSWFFVSTGWLAYFDSWLILGLLVCSFARRRAMVAGAILLAPWIDERFAIALPLCLLLRETCAFAAGERTARERRLDALAFAAALLPFFAVRAGAYIAGEDAMTRAYLDAARADRRDVRWTSFLAGAWHGLRFGWVPVVLCCTWVLRKSPGLGIAIIGVVAVTLAVLFTIAADFSRSVSVLLPLSLAGLVEISAGSLARRRWLIWLLASLNLIAPASHVFNNSRLRIFPIDRELTLWRNPPEFLRADYYNVRAVAALGEGRVPEALRLLDVASRLDPNFQPAHLNRATALERTGRFAEALVEADKAVALDATHAQAWFRRANIRQELGDTAGARADLKQALLTATPGDPIRTETQRMLGSLPAETPAP